MTVKHVAIILLIAVLLGVLDFIRRGKLSFKYAFGWLIALLAGLVCAVFQEFFENVAGSLGFELFSNAIFFFCVFLAVVLGLLLTVFLCQLNRRHDKIIQRIALLEKKLDDACQQ